jgi:hypothetical protein
MEKNLELKIDVKGDTVTILHGDAPKPINKEAVTIDGNINAVKEFIATRESKTLDKDTTVILFNEQKGLITLQSNPGHPHNTTINAKLEVYPELNEFGINKEKYYGLREMEKFVRMNRFWFGDKEAHMRLVSELKAFNAKVQSELSSEADQRGNKNQAFKKQVTSELAADFVLTIPLFKGSESSTFRVDICYDVTDAQVRFWLESVELFELQKQAVFKAFEPQRISFVEKGFTVLEV